MIWYCWKLGAHINSTHLQGLLIRGIPEEMIFEVEAETRIDAVKKANEIILTVNSEA